MNIFWAQLNIGCLSRNRFWGESEEKAYRKAECTSTIICSGNECILVDPGVEKEKMKFLLDRRCGLPIERVSTIFFTHLHADHRVDAACYSGIRMVATKEEIQDNFEEIGKVGWFEALEAAKEELIPGVKVVRLPGHTRGCAGLAFDGRDGKILIAGDAVMTRSFFEQEQGYFNSYNHEEARNSIRHIRKDYTLIVPGHDILFYNREYGK